MNIALVTNDLCVGGKESFLFGFASQLRAEGNTVTFVVTQTVGNWHDRPVEDGFAMVSILPRDWESRRGHARRVGEFLTAFDAVLLNHSLTAQSSAGLLAESTVAISVLHNNVEPIYALALANLANIDMLVAVSEGVRREAILRGAPEARICCIRNGVDVFESFPKNECDFSASRPLKAVFIGRIDHMQKGALYLPGIISKALAAGAFLLVDIIGTGTHDFDVLRQQLSTFEQNGIVKIHGALPHLETMGLLQSADVLLMPSHFEGQPIILFEAMARGVVPVVSLLAGITDTVIIDGENGMVVPVGDEGLFANALIELAGDRSRLESMSRAAWIAAAENFSNTTMTRQYIELIEDCKSMRTQGKLHPRNKQMCYSVLGLCSWLPSVIYKVSAMLSQILKRAN